jgi:hypothetical protein
MPVRIRGALRGFKTIAGLWEIALAVKRNYFVPAAVKCYRFSIMIIA